MKLAEALAVLRSATTGARPLALHLVCGFTPLHLPTFVAAHLVKRMPDRKIVFKTGLFGDCLGNLERLAASSEPPEMAIVALEWPDFDPRLGLRDLGGWGPSDLRDILETATQQAQRISAAIVRLSSRMPLCVSLPTLPLPPVSHYPTGQSGSFDLELRLNALRLGAEAARLSNCAVVNSQRLDQISPPALRRDVAGDLATGFPFTIAHASALGELLAALVGPQQPKKGLITDLDDTLWRGLVGEVGAHGISWDLDHKSHAHGLYQQMLRSVAQSGVLLAVSSKNDPAVVDEAFTVREQLSTLRPHLFPVQVSWGPKSEAVGRILQAWNIAPDSVVMIDDSPLELDEVRTAWPGVTCLRFPRESDNEVYALLQTLRDLFGKPSILADDALRLESLRVSEAFREESTRTVYEPDAFLSRLDAELSFQFVDQTGDDSRALELINKTNQFNLNGRRYTPGDWKAYRHTPGVWLLTVNYKDKFGPLGTIAVLAGKAGASGPDRVLHVDCWVMSCRAFSRRIEHACLKTLFEKFDSVATAFEFETTTKNGPLREFFAGVLGSEPSGPFEISRTAFESFCPPLWHRIKELENA